MAELFFCLKKLCETNSINCFNVLKQISMGFDFDYFVENFFSHPLPSSVDTIFFDENEKKLFLIKFKNKKK
ncbi:hypothetical protein [Lebetimonas sp. JS032]|uniref:hypothetical protein n=1 Tax=Lebetimonas sp. JS032 TaxID=990070 RepID=UPI000465D703|nr:hypothetical protein [Lebetimonas sp. JS032]